MLLWKSFIEVKNKKEYAVNKKEEVEDNEKGDFNKSRRKEECNLFRSLSEEAKKQILTEQCSIVVEKRERKCCIFFCYVSFFFKFSLFNIFLSTVCQFDDF